MNPFSSKNCSFCTLKLEKYKKAATFRIDILVFSNCYLQLGDAFFVFCLLNFLPGIHVASTRFQVYFTFRRQHLSEGFEPLLFSSMQSLLSSVDSTNLKSKTSVFSFFRGLLSSVDSINQKVICLLIACLPCISSVESTTN